MRHYQRILLALVFFGCASIPLSAFASNSYSINCSGSFSTSGLGTCVGTTITFTGTTFYNESGGSIPSWVSSAAQVFMYGTFSNYTGSGVRLIEIGDGTTGLLWASSLSSSQVFSGYSLSQSGTFDGVKISGRAGEIYTGICFTDTLGGCSGGGGGSVAPCGTSTNAFSFNEVQDELNCQVDGVGVYLYIIISFIIGILVSLIALGVGVFYLRKYIAGRKF